MGPRIPYSGVKDSIRIELLARHHAMIITEPGPSDGVPQRDGYIAGIEVCAPLSDAHIRRRGRDEERQVREEKGDQLEAHSRQPFGYFHAHASTTPRHLNAASPRIPRRGGRRKTT